MGVTLQKEILLEKLTVNEHLFMMCSFKGLKSSDAKFQVELVKNMLGL